MDKFHIHRLKIPALLPLYCPSNLSHFNSSISICGTCTAITPLLYSVFVLWIYPYPWNLYFLWLSIWCLWCFDFHLKNLLSSFKELFSNNILWVFLTERCYSSFLQDNFVEYTTLGRKLFSLSILNIMLHCVFAWKVSIESYTGSRMGAPLYTNHILYSLYKRNKDFQNGKRKSRLLNISRMQKHTCTVLS